MKVFKRPGSRFFTYKFQQKGKSITALQERRIVARPKTSPPPRAAASFVSWLACIAPEPYARLRSWPDAQASAAARCST